MNYRKFGRTGWQVGDIGYGMWGMGAWSGSEDSESMESLQRAIDLGCNFFDTAWVYGDGHSEKLLGRLLQSERCEENICRDQSATEKHEVAGAGPIST